MSVRETEAFLKNGGGDFDDEPAGKADRKARAKAEKDPNILKLEEEMMEVAKCFAYAIQAVLIQLLLKLIVMPTDLLERVLNILEYVEQEDLLLWDYLLFL